MPIDPIAAALRRDAELLRELAPPSDVAAAWQAVRTAQARKLLWIITLCGWGLRVLLTLVALGLALLAPDLLAGAVLPLVLVGWLSSGICAPLFAMEHRRPLTAGLRRTSQLR